METELTGKMDWWKDFWTLPWGNDAVAVITIIPIRWRKFDKNKCPASCGNTGITQGTTAEPTIPASNTPKLIQCQISIMQCKAFNLLSCSPTAYLTTWILSSGPVLFRKVYTAIKEHLKSLYIQSKQNKWTQNNVGEWNVVYHLHVLRQRLSAKPFCTII